MTDSGWVLDENAVYAACMANFHPDAAPSAVELDKMRRSIRAYLAAAPQEVGGVRAEPVAPYYCTDCESSVWELHNDRCGCGSGRVVALAAPSPSVVEADDNTKITDALRRAGKKLTPVAEGGGAWHYELIDDRFAYLEQPS